MPDTQTHNRTTRRLIAPVFIATTVLLGPVHGIISGVAVFSALFLTPDLDYADKRSVKAAWRESGIGGVALLIYWWPYGKLAPHRGVLSHTPLLGTAVRLVYTVSPIILLFSYYYTLATVVASIVEYVRFIETFYLSLCVPDTIHWIMDVSDTWRKTYAK